jgi:hypothetical protein
MISLLVVFYLFVGLFGIIGAMRGWAKEMLVSFSVVLALAFIVVIESFLPFVSTFITENPKIQFWFRLAVVVAIAFFGYQSPRFARIGKATEKRDQIQDVLLGGIMGLVSGFMIVGTIWSFIDQAGYPFGNYIIPPSSQWPLGDASLRVLKLLPPVWLGKAPNIFVAVVFAFVFVIVVFV